MIRRFLALLAPLFALLLFALPASAQTPNIKGPVVTVRYEMRAKSAEGERAVVPFATIYYAKGAIRAEVGGDIFLLVSDKYAKKPWATLYFFDKEKNKLTSKHFTSAKDVDSLRQDFNAVLGRDSGKASVTTRVVPKGATVQGMLCDVSYQKKNNQPYTMYTATVAGQKIFVGFDGKEPPEVASFQMRPSEVKITSSVPASVWQIKVGDTTVTAQ